MTGWLLIVGYLLCGAMLVMMGIGIALSAFMPALEKWNRKYFITFFILLFLYAVVLTVDVITYTHNDAATQSVIIGLEYLFFSVLTVMPLPFLLHCCRESPKNSVLMRVEIALWGIYCIMLFATRFTDVFYYITPDNQYNRGFLFPLMMAPPAAIVILNIISLIKRRGKISKKIFISMLIYLIPTATLIIVYMFAAIDIFVAFWMFLGAMTMLGLVLMDNIEQYTEQQREIANQRAGLMVLQMRPHFISNTLTSIYCLCDQDPEKAKQITLDFTTYLRKNFTALASEDTVPFTAELEHTRAYLGVEQAQFEDTLFVNFDTLHTMFRLPPLTLQPIVENAVKHGMRESNEPIHISVVTRKTDKASEIIVEDDGPGFKPADDNEPHIALNNIRQRLEWMCKGTLEIAPREGGGTAVKVTIPTSE